MLPGILNDERIQLSWGESLSVAILKKSTRSDCSNHWGISLIALVTKMLALLTLHRLTLVRESNAREVRGCID